MRLSWSASAVAIVLVLIAAGVPPTSAASEPSATIVSPSPGATLKPGDAIRVHYSGYDPKARNASGYLTLDGAPAGTFARWISSANDTTVTVILRPSNATPSGPLALGVRIFNELDAPVDAEPIAVVLDRAPTIQEMAASYDKDEEFVRITATLEDDLSTTVSARAIVLNNWGEIFASANATLATGAAAIDMPIHLRPGTYSAWLNVSAGGSSTLASVAFGVQDRRALVSDVVASYEIGGIVRVSALVADADGISSVWISAPSVDNGGGAATFDAETGRWSGAIRVNVTRLGTFSGSILVWDADASLTTHNFTFVVAGEKETFFEETLDAALEFQVHALMRSIPRSIGEVEICVDDCRPLTIIEGNGVVVVRWGKVEVLSSGVALGAGGRCASLMLSNQCPYATQSDVAFEVFATGYAGKPITIKIAGVRI